MSSSGRAFIPGTPRPQGSARAFVVKGRAIVTADNARTNPWRADIHAAVRAHIGDQIVFPDGPVAIGLEFVMPRRVSEPKRVTPAHTRKPDLDKLCRSALDAIDGLIFADDGQVDDLSARKRTAEIGEQPGMRLEWSAGSNPQIAIAGAERRRVATNEASAHYSAPEQFQSAHGPLSPFAPDAIAHHFANEET